MGPPCHRRRDRAVVAGGDRPRLRGGVYFLFRFVIRWWNLETPGREDEGEESLVQADMGA